MSTAPVLELRGVSKTYPGVRALTEVSLSLGAGRTLGLVGENGAGKSTLLDVISGIQRPSAGEILLRGKPVALGRPQDAIESGIFRVHQEQALIGVYPVYQNLFLGAEARFTRAGFLDRARMRRQAETILSELEIDLPVAAETGALNFGVRQLVEIARSVALCRISGIDRPLVLLDEPTSSLSGRELERFFGIVDRLKTRFRASMIFISHRLGEVVEISDDLLVLKDGRVVGAAARHASSDDLHRMMVGRDRTADFYCVDLQNESFGPPVLQLRDFSSDRLQPLDLEVRTGEIVGVGGLVQSGKTELGRAIAGSLASRGTIALAGTDVGTSSIDARIAAGLGYVPLHRHLDGIMLGRSVRDNLVLPNLARFVRAGMLRAAAMNAFADEQVRRFAIKTSQRTTRAGTLSGGNQQKIVLAKWLARKPKLLVVDNPTRGVDAGAKEEIYRLLRAAAAAGCGLLLITDDLVELIELSNRILFLREGRVTGEVQAPAGRKPAEGDLVHLMV